MGVGDRVSCRKARSERNVKYDSNQSVEIISRTQQGGIDPKSGKNTAYFRERSTVF